MCIFQVVSQNLSYLKIGVISTIGISEILLSNFQETVKSDEWSVREAVETLAVII